MQAESLVTEVMGQMLLEISSTEIKLEQERVAEEKRKLEEARLVPWQPDSDLLMIAHCFLKQYSVCDVHQKSQCHSSLKQ